MTDYKLPEGRKAMTDADMGDLTRRLADTAIEQSALYRTAIKRAEDAEAKLEKALRVFDDMQHDRIGFRNVGYFRRIATVIGKELKGETE